MAKLAAKTYGESLFELALEEDKIDLLLEEALFVQQILNQNKDLLRLMTHPKVSKEEKQQVTEQIFKGKVSDEMTGFLAILILKGRFKEVEGILAYFIAKVKEYKKIGVAFVTTAVELKEEQKQALTAKLLSTTEYETMEINYATDNSLIGGMVIRIGDRVVDSSIKHKLNDLTRELLKVQLA
ncbi:MAG: F0F1 ATP synthase subunit delta [Lachnospiraceae bacterium]|nr:F0F1 ATP synthase subunit delta [Lachnospiraceae bacterium]